VKKALRIFVALLALAAACAATSPLVLYLLGLRLVPQDQLTLSIAPMPQKPIAVVWASLGGSGAPRIDCVNPYTFVWRLWSAAPAASPEDQVAILGSRALLGRAPRLSRAKWKLASASAYIWTTRHWTAEQAISTFLAQAYFGHGFTGLEAAARGYFGRAAVDLSSEQLAHLIVVTRAPSNLDPWCHGYRNRSAAREVIARLPADSTLGPLNLLPPPANACGA